MSPLRFNATVLCSALLLTMLSAAMGVPEVGPHVPPPTHRGATDYKDTQSNGGRVASTTDSKSDHQIAKRFIWTLTQEPYFYDRYGTGEEERGTRGHVGGGGEGEGGAMTSETLPQALPLRNPSPSSSQHKRLYPKWYQAYMYKSPSFNHIGSPVGEHKRFQPFHPLARFRGLSLGGASSPSSGYHSYELPLMDHPGHRLPTAPNAQPSQYDSSLEEDEDEEGEGGKPVRVGELLHLLKSIAGDRGLSGHTKSFRFGISRRK